MAQLIIPLDGIYPKRKGRRVSFLIGQLSLIIARIGLGELVPSIRDIGKEVGYNDTAYFCRRFKMMFGIPAGKMRRRETLINV